MPLCNDTEADGELYFSSDALSFLGAVSDMSSCHSDLKEDYKELFFKSKGNHRLSNKSSDSTVVVAAASMAGSDVVLATQKRKKSRAYRYNTSLFITPIYFNSIAEFYGPQLVRKTFRMSRGTSELLLNTVRDLLDRSFVSATEYRRATVPADIRLAITMRILAGASYCNLSLAYQVKEATVFDIFTSTCDALMSRLYLEGFPRTKLALQHIA